MERVVLVILSIAVVGLGLAPWFAMDLMRPAIALIVGVQP
jgi:Flp pilus assembly protein CpaB